MTRLRVGVLRGGPSGEYDVSLKTGAAVLNGLPEERYEPVDIFISREGQWHRRGVPVDVPRALRNIDVIFNALHGAYGEDGKVQRILDAYGMPYTGSPAVSSALAMNKLLARRVLGESGLKMPQHTFLTNDPDIDIKRKVFELFRSFPQPAVVKPAAGGSSLGVHIAHGPDALAEAIVDAFTYGDTVLVEEYVRGKEATCGVVEGFRNMPFYTLLPIEIRPPKNTFFDYTAKYSGGCEEVCPGNFTRAESDALQAAACRAHQTLGLAHYSRSDFIVSSRGIYFLEANTLPGLTESSLVPKALAAAGATLPQFLDHVVQKAYTRT